MSANFLNRCGLFEGLDIHTYITVVPPGEPLPAIAPHAVGNIHYVGRTWREVSSVRAEGSPVLQSGWAMIFIPHFAMTVLPPHPIAQPATLVVLPIQSSSAPVLSVHSVTAKGTALLTALIGPFGLNSDCGLQPVPTGVDLNLDSVITSPTLGDYCAAAVGAYLNSLYNMTAFIPWNGITIGVALLQNFLDLFHEEPIANLISKLEKSVQQAVDK